MMQGRALSPVGSRSIAHGSFRACPSTKRFCLLNERNRFTVVPLVGTKARQFRLSAELSSPEAKEGELDATSTSEKLTFSADEVVSERSTPGLEESKAHTYSSSEAAAPPPPVVIRHINFTDRHLLFLGLIACATTGALSCILLAAIPTLIAFKKAADSLTKLAETAREELPGTMAAVRLSGMEISDLTMELSDLGQEISEGVRSSTRAVRAAEDGLRRMGSFSSLRESHRASAADEAKGSARSKKHSRGPSQNT